MRRARIMLRASAAIFASVSTFSTCLVACASRPPPKLCSSEAPAAHEPVSIGMCSYDPPNVTGDIDAESPDQGEAANDAREPSTQLGDAVMSD